MRKKGIIFIYFLIIMCFAVLSVFSATESTKRVRYDYSAKRVISDNKTGVTILKGDAKFTKISTEPNANSDYIYGDQITIYKDTQTNKTTRMEAMGNVKIKEGDMTVTCTRAVMKYEPEEVIEMEGSPAVVDEKENKIEAPFIKYYRNDDRLEAESTEGYVTGNITIEEKESQEKKETETNNK